MPASQTCAPMTTNRVYLVNKYYAWGILFALYKQISYPRGAHSHKHLNKIRTAYAEERHARLSRDGPGQECLAGARRSDKEDAFWYPSPQPRKFLWITQKVDNLLELFLGLINTGDIFKGHLLLGVGH